jgi:hypothetical protein
MVDRLVVGNPVPECAYVVEVPVQSLAPSVVPLESNNGSQLCDVDGSHLLTRKRLVAMAERAGRHSVVTTCR